MSINQFEFIGLIISASASSPPLYFFRDIGPLVCGHPFADSRPPLKNSSTPKARNIYY